MFEADLDAGVSLALALEFDGEQPGYFDAGPARAQPLEVDGFVGDTERGGSCNVARLDIVPHCQGTHTESAAHVLGSAPPPGPPAMMPARLVTVSPEALCECGETYPAAADGGEAVISRRALEARPPGNIRAPVVALIVRTRTEGRGARRYHGDNPHPYFTLEAIDWLEELGVEHLLVDTPSIDRGRDDGTLPAHRRYWALDAQRRPTRDRALIRTITEFIDVPAHLDDGVYLLNLQLPDWKTDAVPSRPVLFAMSETERG